MDSVLIKRPSKDTETHREKEVRMKIDTEIGVMYPSIAKKRKTRIFL